MLFFRMGSRNGTYSRHPRAWLRDGNRHCAAEEGGFALIFALLVFITAMGFVMSGSMLRMAHRKEAKIDFARNAQAVQLARSGLTEALGWFRKQSAQPVTAFAPVLDRSATPPLLETEDPDIGLVREFRITGTTWGRWEVWKEWASDPDAERAAWRQKVRARDISQARQIGAGGSWILRSVGFVYNKVDDTVAFNEYPNSVIATEILETEVGRLSLTPPGQAAINTRRGVNVTVNTKGRVFGGSSGAGIYYPQSTGTPSTGGAGSTRVTGTPPVASTPAYDDSFETVFGVARDELESMADDVITDMSNFPATLPENSVVFVKNPSIKFDSSLPLRSTGSILVVEGNVTLVPGNASTFSGLLYVDGNLTIREPCEFKGSIVVTGNTTVQGSADFADIYFDDDVLNRLRIHVGNYRLSGAMRRPAL